MGHFMDRSIPWGWDGKGDCSTPAVLREDPTPVNIDPLDCDTMSIRQLILDNGARLGTNPSISLQRITKPTDIGQSTATSSLAETKSTDSYSATLVVHRQTPDKKAFAELYVGHVGLVGQNITEALMHLLNKIADAMKDKVEKEIQQAQKAGNSSHNPWRLYEGKRMI